MRLLDGAVIKCCGECKHKTNNLSVSDVTLCSKPPFLEDENKFYRVVKPDTIDKDCPLAEVEYYPNNADLQNLLNMDTLSAEFLNNIEAVIIVKKRGDK